MYKFKFLWIMLLVSLAAVIFLPIYTSLFLYPSFTNLLAESTEQETVQIASHLASMIMAEIDELERDTLSPQLLKEIEEIELEFNLAKVKLYSPLGEVIYSTERKDIGQINKKKYFSEIVAKGNTLSKIVKKDTRTSEDQLMPVDVVETYIPIMKGEHFLGAFEIYRDVTERKEEFDQLISHSTTTVLIITFCLLAAVIISSIKANRTIIELNHAEKELRKHRNKLEEIVQERTEQIRKTARQLEQEIVERKKIEKKLHEMSITDELTGLLNRRGFFAIAEKHLKIAHRNKRNMFLLFIDLDDLKSINDSLGHQVGDLALVETANILKNTFRESDIIARIGGDEFSVFTVDEVGSNEENIINRLQENFRAYNSQENRTYDLSISIGVAGYDPENPRSIEELLVRADRLMYKSKKEN